MLILNQPRALMAQGLRDGGTMAAFSSDLVLKATVLGFTAFGLAAAIGLANPARYPTRSVAYVVAKLLSYSGGLAFFISFIAFVGVATKIWQWPFYLVMPASLAHLMGLSSAQWFLMRQAAWVWDEPFPKRLPPPA